MATKKVIEVQLQFGTRETPIEPGTAYPPSYATVNFSSENGCRLTVSGSGLEPPDLELVQRIMKEVTSRIGTFPNLEKQTAQAAAKKKYPDDDGDEEYDEDDNG